MPNDFQRNKGFLRRERRETWKSFLLHVVSNYSFYHYLGQYCMGIHMVHIKVRRCWIHSTSFKYISLIFLSYTKSNRRNFLRHLVLLSGGYRSWEIGWSYCSLTVLGSVSGFWQLLLCSYQWGLFNQWKISKNKGCMAFISLNAKTWSSTNTSYSTSW